MEAMNVALERTLQQEIVGRERSWIKALRRKDTDKLDHLLHDEFTSTPARSAGEVLGKTDYIEAARHVHVAACKMEILQVQTIGQDLMVVKARLHCISENEAVRVCDDLLITDVWLSDTDDQWRAITRHVSKL